VTERMPDRSGLRGWKQPQQIHVPKGPPSTTEHPQVIVTNRPERSEPKHAYSHLLPGN
jgi:hypothetical protein